MIRRHPVSMAVSPKIQEVAPLKNADFRESAVRQAIGAGLAGVGWAAIAWANPSLAQVIPDATLPSVSIVAPSCITCLIGGGTVQGTNLFHSFREFSIPTGGVAYFNNASPVQNILVRVTGTTRSTIDGLITANGSPNLFLLNPNGITFGPNAQLLLGGSFLATTGSSFKFAGGSEFSATTPQAPDLLAVNVPIGLQVGSARPPGDIQVQGASLAVPTGKTLALVGGDVTIAGRSEATTGLIVGGFPYAIVNGYSTPTTPGGRAELWAVQQGEVAIGLAAGQLALSVGTQPISFGTLQLLQRAQVNVSGTAGGEIQVQAGKFYLNAGSSLVTLTAGGEDGRNITVNASELFEINGTGDYRAKVMEFTGTIKSASFFEGGLYAFSFGAGAAGSIIVNTPNFIARNGAYVVASNLTGQGGSVTLNVPIAVSLDEALIATTTGLRDSIAPATEDPSGAGSRLTINTGTLRLENTSLVSTIGFSTGRGGDLIVNATRAIDLSSADPVVFGFDLAGEAAVGGLFSTSISRGDAGNISIATPRLTVRDGASIDAGSITPRSAGVITIEATESIDVFGRTPSGLFPSRIIAGSYAGSFGSGGNLSITTGRLRVWNQGEVSVQSRGAGQAGSLRVVADTIALDTQGLINGTTSAGTGGNLTLHANLLSLRHGSRIRTDAGASNGGNITIQAGFVVANLTENSDITANALTTGNGGKVNITAQGIYGLEFQPQLTPLSDITASSQFGINGTVTLNIPNLDPSRGTIDLPVNLADSSRQIAQTCSPQQRGNSFVITGRRGLSADPTEALNGTLVWAGEWGSGGVGEWGARGQGGEGAGGRGSPIVEMTGWIRNSDGSTSLIAQDDRPIGTIVATCQTQSAGGQP